MNKLLLVAIALIANFVVKCQDRVNLQPLKFVQSSGVLSMATGWAYNDTRGKWVDYTNVISDDISFKEEYKILQGAYHKSQEDQNFISIQTKTVDYKNKKYFVLIVLKWEGEYKYPSIMRDWYTYKDYNAYIFSETEYSKLKNLSDSTELQTYRHTLLSTDVFTYSDAKFLDFIRKELDNESQYSDYRFPIKKTPENKIRFYVPESLSTYSDFRNFQKSYFETDYQNFSKFIIK